MRIVSAAKYAALQTRYRRTDQEREDAEKLAAERLATIKQLRAERDRLRDAKPDSPVQHPQPVLGDAELRRQLHLAQRTIRSQAEQLEQLQTSHIADTRELHDLRQGVTS